MGGGELAMLMDYRLTVMRQGMAGRVASHLGAFGMDMIGHGQWARWHRPGVSAPGPWSGTWPGYAVWSRLQQYMCGSMVGPMNRRVVEGVRGGDRAYPESRGRDRLRRASASWRAMANRRVPEDFWDVPPIHEEV